MRKRIIRFPIREEFLLPRLRLLMMSLGWAKGASLDEIAEMAPFDLLTGRFEVPDNNPANGHMKVLVGGLLSAGVRP